MPNPIIIFGCTSLGKLAAHIFKANDILINCFLDDNPDIQKKNIQDISILGKLFEKDFLDLFDTKWEAFIAVDDIDTHSHLIDFLKKKYNKMPLNAIHHMAYLSEDIQIGYGNLIDVQTVLNIGTNLGNYCSIHAGTIIGQEVKIEDFVYMGMGTRINAKVHIGKNVIIGSGTLVYPNVRIGENSKILGGAIIKKNVPASSVIVS